MPQSVLLTTLSLAAFAALGGYVMGQRFAQSDLSGLVNAVAAEHVRLYGGKPDDCFGWVAQGEMMPRVRCAETVYRIDAFGSAIPMQGTDL